MSSVKTAQVVPILHHSDMTPPPPPPDLGCAIHPDGSLKDASEIEWHFDKDDETPLTATEKSPSPGPTLSSSSWTPHPFFLGHAQAPEIFVAGSHHSSHAIHPSNCIVDPDNVMNSAPGWSSTKNKVVAGKRKAPTQIFSCHVVQKTDHMVHWHTSEDSNNDNSKVSTTSTSKNIYFTHLILRQFTQSRTVMPLLMFAQSSDRIKSTGIQILQRSRMDTGASFACKQLNSKQSVFRYK